MGNIDKDQAVGWIGAGVMGKSMCRRLLAAGLKVILNSRSQRRCEDLLDEGASWRNTIAEVASETSICFVMVGFPDDLSSVYFSQAGLRNHTRPDSVVVDMSTGKPEMARMLHRASRELGFHWLDAPVTGGDVGARNGTLSIMVGGNPEALERVRPYLELLGNNIIHHGPSGAGQDAKLTNQIVIAGTMIGVCEGLLYAKRAGLDLERVLQSINRGAAGCWTLENLAPRMLRKDFEPGFIVEHFIKDMGIALDEAGRLGLSLPGLSLVHQLYRAVRAQGHGRKGTHALLLALEHLNGH